MTDRGESTTLTERMRMFNALDGQSAGVTVQALAPAVIQADLISALPERGG